MGTACHILSKDVFYHLFLPALVGKALCLTRSLSPEMQTLRAGIAYILWKFVAAHNYKLRNTGSHEDVYKVQFFEAQWETSS